MKKLYGKLATVLLFGLSAFSVYALEFGLMRIPDSLAPCREEIVDGVGYANAVSIQLPGGGSMMLQNETGGGVMSSPIPVHAVEAVGGFLEKFQKNKSIAAEVSGTTWFACALEEADFAGQRCSFFHGPIVVRGYCFVLYLRTPANRGLDATVRSMLRQVTLLPPEDGNSEPTIPLVKMDLAKVPPIDDMPNWEDIAKAFKREVVTASASAIPLPPLPAVVTAPKAPTVKPLVSDDFMNAAMRKAAISHVRESLREFLGPMSDEANAAFEKRWNAVSDYPAPEILDWLKKASPIISEQVRLKASVDTAMVACDDALREAVYAQTFGNAAAEREQMRTYAEILTAMKTAQARMNELQKQLDELGEMPEPDELRRRDAEAALLARETVAMLRAAPVAATPIEVKVDPDLYYVLDRVEFPYGSTWRGEGTGPESYVFNMDGQRPEDGCWIDEKAYKKAKFPRDAKYNGLKRNVCRAIVTPRGATFELDLALKGWLAVELGNGKYDWPELELEKIRQDWKVEWRLSKVFLKAQSNDCVDVAASFSVAGKDPKLPGLFYKPPRLPLEIHGDYVRTVGEPLFAHRNDRFAMKMKGPSHSRHNQPPDHQDYELRFGGIYEFRPGSSQPFGIKLIFRLERSQGAALQQAIARATARFAALLDGDGNVPDELSSVSAPVASEEDEAKAERIALHRQNITFIEGTIVRLQKELAGEKDPSRRAALEWQIVCERSSVIYEQDRIRAEETGTFTASRTPFDEMCRVQQRENTRRQIQEAERLNRARRRVESLMGKMPAVEWDATDRIIDKINAEDPLDAEQWIKLGDALEKKYTGRLEYAQGMAESDLVDAEDRLLRAEKVKTRCDIALALGGVAGAPGAISLLYQTGTGFVEDGVKGAVKNAACFYCDAIDIACSTYDGYKENGLEGALKGAVWSTIMNKGVPVLASKVQGKLNTDVRDLFGGKGKVAASAKVKAGATGKAKADVSDNKEVMGAEVTRAKSEISEFIRAQNAFNQAKLEHMSDKELAKIKSDLAAATARVNENPTAKACLKYDNSYKKVGEAFDGTLGKIHETVKTRFYADMKAKGFNDQEIVQFRNASSKGTVGMDADWGLVETPNMVLTRNGKRVSVYEWQREATDSWNRSYKDTTGFDAQKSWENVTTHAHAEAYRNKKILEYSKEADNMEEILSAMSASDAQQAFDVTGFKAATMLNNKDLPLPVRVREAVRGTAKDMKSKLIPALDVKIKALRKTEAALTKQGKALSKSDAHNLARLEAAKAHFEKVEKTFDEIGRYVGNGKDKIPPEDWDDAIRTETGGRGVLEEINDMVDMFKSLVF